jgi:hypothetical protein
VAGYLLERLCRKIKSRCIEQAEPLRGGGASRIVFSVFWCVVDGAIGLETRTPRRFLPGRHCWPPSYTLKRQIRPCAIPIRFTECESNAHFLDRPKNRLYHMLDDRFLSCQHGREQKRVFQSAESSIHFDVSCDDKFYSGVSASGIVNRGLRGNLGYGFWGWRSIH